MAQIQFLDKTGLEVLVTNIKAADKKITDANTALAERVTATEAALTTLNGTEETAGSVAKAVKDAVDAEAQRAKAAEEANAAAITAIEEAIGTGEAEGSITDRIGQLETALAEGGTTAVAIKANADAIATLNADKNTTGSVDAKVDALRKELLGEEGVSDDVVDTFKELQEYIEAHGTEAADMASAIKNNADAITVLNGADTVSGSVAKAVKDAVDAEVDRVDSKIGNLGKVSDEEGAADQTVKGYVDAAVAGLESGTVEQATKDADGNVISTTYVKVADVITEAEINALFA